MAQKKTSNLPGCLMALSINRKSESEELAAYRLELRVSCNFVPCVLLMQGPPHGQASQSAMLDQQALCFVLAETQEESSEQIKE